MNAGSIFGTKWFAIVCCLAAWTTAFADEVIFADRFQLGFRPRGNRGDLREAFANTSLNDFWLEIPGTNSARWQAADGDDFGWQFSGSSIDPMEPPEDAFGGNGTITARGRPATLVPLAPTGTVSVAANLLPLNFFQSWVAIGFTSSGILSNNFENFAQVWLRLYGNGDYEVRTSGTTGQVVTGHISIPGFTPVKLIYDPVTRRVSGFVDTERFADFTNATVANIQFVGLDANTGDPTYFAHANYFRVMRVIEPVAAPKLEVNRAPGGTVLRWPAANRFVLQWRSSLTPFVPWTNIWPANSNASELFVTNPASPSGFFRLREL